MIEDENTVSHIRITIIFSIIMSVISLGVIYIIAKRLSKTIVKPVEETFENKKGFNRNSIVILENVDTGEIKEFETQKELAEYIGIPLCSVNRYVLGKRKQPEGYKIYRKKS